MATYGEVYQIWKTWQASDESSKRNGHITLVAKFTDSFPAFKAYCTGSDKQYALGKRIKKVGIDFTKVIIKKKKDPNVYFAKFFPVPVARDEQTTTEAGFLNTRRAEVAVLKTRNKQSKVLIKGLKRKLVETESEKSLTEIEKLKLEAEQEKDQDAMSELQSKNKNLEMRLDEMSKKHTVVCAQNEDLSAQNKSVVSARYKLFKSKVAKDKYIMQKNLLLRKLERRDVNVKQCNIKLAEQAETIEILQRQINEKEMIIQGKDTVIQQSKDKILDHETEIVKLRGQVFKLSRANRASCPLAIEEKEDETVLNLMKQKKELEIKIKELLKAVALLEDTDRLVHVFDNGKYIDELRECVVLLVTVGKVSLRNVTTCINGALKLVGRKLGEEPSIGLMQRILGEAKVIINSQIEDELTGSSINPLQNVGHTQHGDSTTKFSTKYQGFQVTTLKGKTLSLGMREQATGSAEATLDSFRSIISDICFQVQRSEPECLKKVAEIMTSFKNTMSDQGAVNPLFNEKFAALRKDLLPLVVENWDSLPSEGKEEVVRLGNFYCKMHILVNFASECDKTLHTFEKLAYDEMPDLKSAIQTSESGPVRTVRTAAKLLHHRGSDEAGVASVFIPFLNERGRKFHLSAFEGNRFNIIFKDAAALYHHKTDIESFYEVYGKGNRLVNAVEEDMSKLPNIAGIRALGILYKLVTQPFEGMLLKVGNILTTNPYLERLQKCLEKFCEDASPLLEQFVIFEDIPPVQDEIYHSLFENSYVELDSLTQQALELMCSSLLIILERQAKDHLPGGKFSDGCLTEALRKQAASVPKTNTVSERDFAVLDYLVRLKPAANTDLYETMILWAANRTHEWLNCKTEEEKAKIWEEARKQLPNIRNKYRERKDAIRKEKIRILMSRQEKKEAGELRVNNEIIKITNDLAKYGMVWTTSEQVDRMLNEFKKKPKGMITAKEALVTQLKYRKKVVKSNGDSKLFNLSKNGKQLTVEELEQNLKTVLLLNPLGGEQEVQSNASYTLATKVTREEIIAIEKSKLHAKLSEQRLKRITELNKEKLPLLLKDPKQLENKKVSHKTRDSPGQPFDWFSGTVLKIDQENNLDVLKTEYEIKYDIDPDETYNFPLLQELKNGALIIYET